MKNLVIDFPSRVKYHTKYTRDLSTIVCPERLKFADGLSPNEKVAMLPNSYEDWHALLEKHYPSHVNPWLEDVATSEKSRLGYFLYHRFLHTSSSIDPALIAKILPKLEKSHEEEYPFVFSENSEIIDLFWDQLQSSLMSIFQETPGLAQNHSLFPWRFYYYDLGISSKTQSNRWHYDLEIPGNIFFVMIYLNDAPGFGTGLYGYHSSKAISKEHGYISSPPNYRTSSLDFYHQYDAVNEPLIVDAKQGDMIFFCPSRCLHRGFVPVNNVQYSRKVLHITFSILPRDVVDYPSLDPVLDPYSLADMSRVMPIGRSFAPYWAS